FNVKEFELQEFKNGEWDTFYKGENIGACSIIKLPVNITTNKLKFKILKSTGLPAICHLAVSNESSKGIRK
ncbi:MAG: hypothetical protein ACOVNY_13820, partial [Chitinophagaceae bacterium]